MHESWYTLSTLDGTEQVGVMVTLYTRIREMLGSNSSQHTVTKIFHVLPLIKYGPHKKQRIQQFFYCCLWIRCLATYIRRLRYRVPAIKFEGQIL